MTASPDEIAAMAHQAFVVDWAAAASMTCVLYDHALTFGQESLRMWPGRMTLPKILFFLNRYLVSAMLVFNGVVSARSHLAAPFCVFYLRWLACTVTVANAVVQGILVLRVWAVYRTNKLVLALAFAFYCGGVITLVGLTVHDYIGEDVKIENKFDFLPGCSAIKVPKIIAGYWIAPVIVESVLFALIVSRAIPWWREVVRAPPTLVLVARDSAVYFAVIFALLSANLFVFLYGPSQLASLLVTPVNAASCIIASRMLLNLRQHVSDPSVRTIGGHIEFASTLCTKSSAHKRPPRMTPSWSPSLESAGDTEVPSDRHSYSISREV